MPDASFEYIIRLPEARDSQTDRRRAAMFRDLGQASARPPGVLPGWTLGAHRQCVHRAESQAPGLARKLMETMLEWCASHEIDQVTLAALALLQVGLGPNPIQGAAHVVGQRLERGQ